ncbi:MAG: Ig-like domain-containing protein [Thermodesulfobacteriota bacterium]
MKKIICLHMILFVCLLGWAIPARAYFENDHLLLSIYNEEDNQVGVDLGSVDALIRTAGSNQVLVAAGSFSLDDFGAAVDSWSDLAAGVFTCFLTGSGSASQQNMYFATTLTTAPAVNFLSATTMQSGSGSVHTLYRMGGGDAPTGKSTYVGSAAEWNGYDVKMNQNSNNPGGFAGFHNEGLNNPMAEPTLEDLATTGYIDLYLYQWAKNVSGNHFIPGVGADYQGIVRIKNDGSVLFNPAGLNQPPVVAAIGDQEAVTGSTVTVAITATDADGDSLSAAVYNQQAVDPRWTVSAPSGGSGSYSWTARWTIPAETITPSTDSFTVKVTDNKGGEGARAFTITVLAGSAAPVITAIPDQTGKAGEALTFTINASDSDEEEGLTLSHTTLPAGVEVTDAPVVTGNQYQWTFTWTPLSTQLGTHTITFTVSDTDTGTADATETVEIVIASDLKAPSVHAPVDKTEFASLAAPDLVIAKPNHGSTVYTYDFQISKNKAMTDDDLLAHGENVPETTGQFITWELSKTLAEDLEDNTWYYWRARSNDGENHSSWVTASFQVNLENEQPGVPAGMEPKDNAVKDTRTPTLKCGIAVDPDDDILKYEFAIYLLDGAEPLVTGEVDGVYDPEHPEIAWTVPEDAALGDKTAYYWRVRAVETLVNGLSGDWSEAYAFSVDTDSDTSLIPTLVYPVNQEIAVNRPKLKITNSGSACQKPYYYFEIIERGAEEVCGAFQGTYLVQSPGIPQGQVDPPLPGGSDWETGEGGIVLPQDPDFTYWKTPALKDETHYCWRVRLVDAADTENAVKWSATGTFFVNLKNDPPTAPVILEPTGGAVISDAGQLENLTLRARPSVDRDEDRIVYEFRLLKNGGEVATEAVEDVAEWKIPILLDNHATYQWQVRAYDEHAFDGGAFDPNCASPWSGLAEFHVSINGAPSVPTVNSPLIGSVISSLKPELSVINSVDPDGDDLQYEFEIYNDLSFAAYAFVASGVVSEGQEITNWKVPVTLTDGMRYYWRSRALDSALQSTWTATASFRVDTAFVNQEIVIAASKKILAAAMDVQELVVNDPTSPAWGVKVSIPPGAVSGDILLTIGYVNNPPGFRGGIRLLNKVFVFGPSGYTFNRDVSIRLPYSQADLKAAGVSDPTKLKIYHYNQLTDEWEAVDNIEVDTYGRFITFKVRHFSMYAAAHDQDGDDTPHDVTAESSNDDGGMCFISTTDGGMNFGGRLAEWMDVLAGLTMLAAGLCFRKKRR